MRLSHARGGPRKELKLQHTKVVLITDANLKKWSNNLLKTYSQACWVSMMPMGCRGYRHLEQSRRTRLHRRMATFKLPWETLHKWLFFFSLRSDSMTLSHRPRYIHWKLHASIISIYYIKPQWCFNSLFQCTSISKTLAWLPLPLPQWQL